MLKKILTLEDLYSFFSSHNETFNFSAANSGYNIAVQIPASFETKSTDDDTEDGFMYVRLKVCHTGINRNKSRISEKDMQAALPSLHYRPILADIVELSDGTKDFSSHSMEMDKDTKKINYIEKPIGVFINPESYSLEYDEEMEKTYVMADGVIYEDYGNESCDIIRRKGGTKVSCELSISELSYDAKEKVLDLTKFRFNGCTCLGTNPDTEKPVEEGMEGARLDIQDFSEERNSLFYRKEDKIISMLQSLQDTLVRFEDKTNMKKGGNCVKLQELLGKYSKTEADLDFDYSNLSDEELEAKFVEVFGEIEESAETEPEGEGEDKTGNPEENGNDSENETEPETESEENFSRKPVLETLESGNVSVSFEISHEDVRSALYTLLYTSLDEEDLDEWFMINKTYDSHFVYSNWDETKIYRQKYAVDGDSVSLDGDRVQLFKEYLTESEKSKLEDMRSNYAKLEETVHNYETEKADAEKELVFSDEAYADLAEDKDFIDLQKKAGEFSVEEIRTKADLIFAAYAKKSGHFSKHVGEEKPHKIGLNFDHGEKEYRPYGALFDDFEK